MAEHDVYTHLPPDGVERAGTPVPPGHREQSVRLTVDGVTGLGHLPVITRGTLDRRGVG